MRSGAPAGRHVRPGLLGSVVGMVVLAAAGVVFAFAALARPEPLAIDLSRHLVAITTAYAGSDVLLFGTTDGEGDVVMVVRGPSRTETVRRKGKQGIIWIDQEAVEFSDVPGFYQVAASRPLSRIATRDVLARNQIGVQNLELPLRVTAPMEASAKATFRQAFLDLKRNAGLYAGDDVGETSDSKISFPEDRLFRVNVTFPANAPVGRYLVDVYLFRDGEIVSARGTPLTLSKMGISADIFDLAMGRPFLYGLCAVIVALFSGWLAGALASRHR